MGSDRYFISDLKNKPSYHFQNEIVLNMEDRTIRTSSNLDLFYGSRVPELVRSSMALMVLFFQKSFLGNCNSSPNAIAI